ncbi:unnamed protein product, partial [Pelagomonas calceolata]
SLLDVAVVSRLARALLRAPFRGLSRLLRVDGVGERRFLGHGRVVGRGRRVGGVGGRILAAERLRLLDKLFALGLAVDAPFRNGPALLLNVLLRGPERSFRGHFLRVLLAAGERDGGRLFVDDHRIVVARLEQRLGALLGQLLGLLLVGFAHRC